MVNSSVLLREVNQLAKAHLLAKSAFNRAYWRFWETEVKPCSDPMGWKILGFFRVEVEKYLFKHDHREQGIDQAAWEIFRLELVGKTEYSFEDLVGFVKWYEVLKRKIGNSLAHLYEFQGDSFGDLVDSYPLAGPELVERALASHPKSDRPRREGYLDQGEVGKAVLEKFGLGWHKLICAGENYIEEALKKACRKCFLYRILTAQDEQITWSEDEKVAVGFAGHQDH